MSSYMMTPKANMSISGPTRLFLPPTSGAMYPCVPQRVTMIDLPPLSGSRMCARPKSHTFTRGSSPCSFSSALGRSSSKFWSLRSAWMIPCEWMYYRASRVSCAYACNLSWFVIGVNLCIYKMIKVVMMGLIWRGQCLLSFKFEYSLGCQPTRARLLEVKQS